MIGRFTRLVAPNTKFLPIAFGSSLVAAGYLYSTAVASPYTKTLIRNDGNIAAAAAVFNGDNEWYSLKIAKIEQLSHDTRRYTFALPSNDHVTGLVTASCLLAKLVTPKGSNIIRPYTPVSDEKQKGQFDVVVKCYETGKFTPRLFELKENDTVDFKGPIIKFHLQPNQFDSITLLGAGSGITPLFQMLRKITSDPNDKTKVHLIYGNKTVDDILLRNELDEMAAKFPDKVKVTYFVDKPPFWGFKGIKGYITKNFLQKNIAGPNEKTHVFLCGPPPFMDAYSGPKKSPKDQGELTGILAELGYSKDQVFKF